MPNFAFATKDSKFKNPTYADMMSCYGWQHIKKQSKTMDPTSREAVLLLGEFIKNCPQKSLWSNTLKNDAKSPKAAYYGQGYASQSKKSFVVLGTTAASLKFNPPERQNDPFEDEASWNMENIEDLINVVPVLNKICKANDVSFNHNVLKNLLKIKQQLSNGDLTIRRPDALQDLGDSSSWLIYLPEQKKYADHRGHASTLASARLYESKEAAMRGLDRLYEDAVVVRAQISVKAIEYMEDPNLDISPLLEARSLVERQDISAAITEIEPPQPQSQKRKM